MVSVIVPCFNASETIVCTLNSIINQTYDNIEIIIIDDGSYDNTEELIKSFICEAKHNIKYYYQDNKGVSAARNWGISKCGGDYITFLDADDAYDVHYIKSLVDALGDDKHDFAFCKYSFVKKQDVDLKHHKSDNEIGLLNKYEMLEKYVHKRKTMFSFACGIFKKSIIEENNIVFPVDIKYGEDSVFLCKYLFHCRDGVWINKNLYKYHLRQKSAMKLESFDKIQNIYAYEMIKEYWQNDTNFDHNIGEYMVARAIWSIAKEFSGNRVFFERLISEYDLSSAMKLLRKQGDEITIRISSIIYEYSPYLFRNLIRIALKF